jgi:hypothetical protein
MTPAHKNEQPLGPNNTRLLQIEEVIRVPKFPNTTQSSPATNNPLPPSRFHFPSSQSPRPSSPRRSPATAPTVAAEASAAMSQGLSDRDILDAVGTTAAALSLAGSSFIVLCYLLFRELRKFSFKLVFFLAVSVSEPDLGALGSGL